MYRHGPNLKQLRLLGALPGCRSATPWAEQQAPKPQEHAARRHLLEPSTGCTHRPRHGCVQASSMGARMGAPSAGEPGKECGAVVIPGQVIRSGHPERLTSQGPGLA